jgi:hypothetical protein
MADVKPRVLWVARNYGDRAQVLAGAETRIADRLSGDYDLEKRFDIAECGYLLIGRVAMEINPFSAMVTHVDPDIHAVHAPKETRVESLATSYGRSLHIISAIKEAAKKRLGRDFRVVAYTGIMYPVEAQEIFVRNGPIDRIVFKKQPEEWEESYREIAEALSS